MSESQPDQLLHSQSSITMSEKGEEACRICCKRREMGNNHLRKWKIEATRDTQ